MNSKPSFHKKARPNGLDIPRPNLIIFMPDQLRYDALGCSGNPHVRTPNIDKFAARGTRFTNCYLQATVCSQSRCSIFTGNYPHVSGHRSLNNLIKPWEPNLFRSLKESGYHVACLAPRGDTFAPTVTELSVHEYGFLETPEVLPKFMAAKGSNKGDGGTTGGPPPSDDIWSRLFYRGLRNASEAVDYDEAVVRSALKWLDCPPQDKPWVLFMPLLFPHCPFQVEEPYFSMYDRASMPPPTASSDKTGYEPRYMQVNRDQYRTDRATPEIWAEIKATYFGMISRLDDQFGRVVDKIDQLGLWESSITLFFTDHGEYLGDHGLIEKWPSGLSDSLSHEPLIIGGAGLARNRVDDEMTEMVDLLPTLFQLCGVDETFAHCGSSFLPRLTTTTTNNGPETPPAKQYAFTEGGFLLSEEPLLEQSPYPYDIKASLQHSDTALVGKAVACRSKDHTYIYRLYEPPELYDRRADAAEQHNLADVPALAAVRSKMEGVILRWMIESSDFLPWSSDERFPEVALEAPVEQWERRRRLLSMD